MNIVFDARVHLNYYSGISRYIICLLEAYARLYPTDRICVLLNPTIEKTNSIYNVLGRFPQISFTQVNAGHMGPKNYTRMGKIIKQLNPDVYHYPHLDAPIYTGNVPVVATVHDSNSDKNIKKFDDKFGLKTVYFKYALRSTLKKADHVIFVSDSIKSSILNQYNIPEDEDRFTRIYNGFEPDFNKINLEDEQRFIQTKGIQKPYLLFVGQIREHKNIFRVIEAFNQFREGNPNYHLVIVGHNYLNLNLSTDAIHHFDRVNNDELKMLYANCKAFVFPSLFEGFGFPILEAFSFGKPVITSNYGATKEVSMGEAILVDPFSVNSIRNGMVTAIQSDNNDEQRKRVAASYSWETYAHKLRAIYCKVIKS